MLADEAGTPFHDVALFLPLAIALTTAVHHAHRTLPAHGRITPAAILIETVRPAIRLHLLPPGEAPEAETYPRLPYIAPEQTGRMNRPVDHRADLYALGVIFYQALIGRLPFAATDPISIIHAHAAAAPTPPLDLHPNLPTPLANMLLKLLAKEPQARYQSAAGLLADLQHCEKNWRAAQSIPPFPLGQDDISDRLLLPDSVYGRQQELRQLHATMTTIEQGDSQLLLLTGASGMGKTTLAAQLREPFMRRGGLWLSYRAESVPDAAPYAAAIGIMQDFTQQLLAQEATQIATWQERLTSALAGNVGQLLRHIPELGLILPNPPNLPESGVNDPHFLLAAALQVCLKAIAAASHPLLILLDDAHQADADSLRMLHELQQQQSLLLIWAYRAGSPLMGYLAETAALLPAANQICLAPLTLPDTAAFLADTLHTTAKDVAPLAQRLQAKTNGNPFFLRQLVWSLYDQRLIFFDDQLRGWRWDLLRIQAAPLADNVAEFVRDQLQRLPEMTQHVLKVAAVMGTPFSAAWLAVICERPFPEIEQAIWRCLTLGVLTALADSAPIFLAAPTGNRVATMRQMTARYMAAQNEPTDALANPASDNANVFPALYQFAHDELRTAAKWLLPTVDEATIHHQIGWRLWQSMTPAQRETHSVLLAGHLNQATAVAGDAANDTAVMKAIATTNLQASRRALELSGYGVSLVLAQRGIAGLGEESGWQIAPTLMGDLHLIAARAAARLGQFAHSQQLLDAIAQTAPPGAAQDALVQERMLLAYLQGNHKAAARIALEALWQSGIHLPLHPSKRHLAVELVRVQAALGLHPIARVQDLPLMRDANSLRAMSIMAAAAVSVAMFNPNLLMLMGLEMTRQTLKRGVHPLSALGFALYGLLCCGVTGQIERGVAFGELALTLAPQIEVKEYRVFVKYFVYAHVQHWREPVQATLQPLRDLATTGEFEYLALAAGLYPYFTWFINGLDIGQNEQAIAENMHLLASFEGTPLYYRYQMGRQYYQNLMGLAEEPGRLAGAIYDERELLPQHQAQNDHATIFYLACHKLTLCYLFGDYAQGLEAATLAAAHSDGGVGTPLLPALNFYDSLTRLAIYPDATGRTARELWRAVVANQKKLARWARYGPANCAHRHSMVAAEMARLQGENGRARELYDTTVRLAQAHDYLPELPLAHELAANFYLGIGQAAYAEHHLRQAHHHYRRWGAVGKTEQLERLHPRLFPRVPAEGPPNLADLSAYLDMATIFKATQLLSGETTLPDLLAQLTTTLMENAGAQAGCLLLPEGRGWRVASRQPAVAETQAETTAVPLSLVWEAARSREPVLLPDVATAVAHAHDPYLRAARPRSALCLPLLDKGELVGVFYLENRLMRHAFAPERLPLLMALGNQAAISLQNATLLTGLQAARQEIATSERRFRLMFENAPLGVLEMDITAVPLKIRAANRRAEALYGWSAAELALLDPALLIPESSREATEHLVKTVRQGQTAVLESANQRRDGAVFPVRLIATPADGADGRYMILAVEDMTAQEARRSELEAIEAERRRIAQEIHDGVAQDLAFLRLKLALWRDWVRTDPEQMQSELDQTEKTLDATIQEIRRSIYALRPLALGEMDFLPALHRYIADFNEQQETYVTLHIALGDDPLPADLELPLFRVIQEGLNNIAQHARASLAWVELAVSGDRDVTLTVRDNGLGFDVAAVAGNGRLGLLQMRERVETAGGHLTLTSWPGQGTEIQIKFQNLLY